MGDFGDNAVGIDVNVEALGLVVHGGHAVRSQNAVGSGERALLELLKVEIYQNI